MLISALMLLASAPSVQAAPSGLIRADGFFTAASPQTLGYGEAQSVWTPERVAAAPPLRLGRDGELRRGAVKQEPFAAPAPLASVELENPAAYPNRVHGKLVGEYRGLGTFSCSATVVSSESASLITTAGHCAYDTNLRKVASHLAFVPGFSRNTFPYGVWPVTNLIVNQGWVRGASLDYDFAMMRTSGSPIGPLQSVVGSRGIGFDQPRKQRLEAYGYPSKGSRHYDGNTLVRCDSGYVGDPFRYGGPQGRGMRCDQQQGASGGGWVAEHSYVVSGTSHGYPRLSNSIFFGPYYGAAAKAMYRANTRGWPSVGPIRCGGQVATIVGTDRGERITGGGGRDVIATLGGNDRIVAGGGRDVVCAGSGNDRISGGGGRDTIEGGQGTDACGKPRGGDKRGGCEGGGKGR